jgi:hypothetical protein
MAVRLSASSSGSPLLPRKVPGTVIRQFVMSRNSYFKIKKDFWTLYFEDMIIAGHTCIHILRVNMSSQWFEVGQPWLVLLVHYAQVSSQRT